MSEAPQGPISQQVETPQAVTGEEWVQARREKRMAERAQERQAEPVETPEDAPIETPAADPEGDPAPEVEVEAETDEPTREDADLQSEGDEAEAEAPEASESDEDFPDTVAGLAESLGFEPNELSEHLQITVRPNGKEETVSLAELAKGYERHGDYKAKTQRLADERREFEAHSQQALERQKAAVERLDTVAVALAQQIDAGPSDAELEKIKDQDRFRYMDEVEKRNQRIQAFQQAQAARQQAAQQAQEEQAATVRNYRKEQQDKLAERLPDMRNPEKAKAVESTITEFLTGEDIGFTPEEVSAFINGPFDHRQVLVIMAAAKAAKQAKVETKVKKRVKKLPNIKSGARRTEAQKRGDSMRSAKQRLKADQSTEAGLNLLKARRLARRNANHGGSQ